MAKAVVRSRKAPLRRAWSKDDMRVLKSMARKETLAKIATALKRTQGATRHKATISGISLALTKTKPKGARKLR